MFCQVKKYMQENKIKAYIVPTADYHNSEYIAPFFKQREALSGFTGSAGTLLITERNAYLWTDGRYFIQAKAELKHGIKLMKQGVKDTKTILEVLSEELVENDKVAFSYKLMPYNTFEYLTFSNVKFNFIDLDILSLFWSNRPTLPSGDIFILPLTSAGLSYQEKLEQVKNEMNKKGVNSYLISALEDIAWILNLRGSDVNSTPVFLSYLLINKEVTLYVDETKLTQEVLAYLRENQINISSYEAIYSDVKLLKDKTVYLDYSRTNASLVSLIKEQNKIVAGLNITSSLKCIKNAVEIKATKYAHLKDGLALVNFWYKFNALIKNREIVTEYDISCMILEERMKQKDFLSPSFTTISAFASNGAIMHYSPSKINSKVIEEENLLLIDSGGQYIDGTTDITRTFAIGEISDKMKLHYTTVLKSVISLSRAVFLEGTTGSNLDILARGPIWNLGIEYRCGTGHGVGHVLSVHEGPNLFRQNLTNNIPLKPGMITTNEPGIYLENEYGIRLEQELLCVDAKLNSEFGEFYKFQTITLCPFDLNCILPELLTNEERKWLNDYHKMVYRQLEHYLDSDVRIFLMKLTRSI